MNRALVTDWLDRFEARLAPSADYSLGDVLEVRDQAAIILEQQFGYDSAVAEKMRSVQYRRPKRLASLTISNTWVIKQLAADVRRAIRNARFMIDVTPEVPDTHAAGLPAESRAHLAMLLGELTDEVEAALIPDDQRDELRDVLRQAQAIIVAERSPDVAKAKLHTVLGRTVATAARAGPATATLWRRVGEWIVLAEATVTLGLGVHAISAPDVTRLEVTCNVQTPALSPGVGGPPTLPPGVRLKPDSRFRPPAELLPGEPPAVDQPRPGESPAEQSEPGEAPAEQSRPGEPS